MKEQKVYIVVVSTSTDMDDDVATTAFSTYNDAKCFFELLLQLRHYSNNWTSKAWDKDGNVKDDYECTFDECNSYENKNESELFWKLTKKDDGRFYDRIELHIRSILQCT